LLWIRLYWITAERINILVSFLILEKIQLSLFSIMLIIGLSNIAFIKLKYDSYNPNCFRIYHKEMLNFIKGIFCLYWNDHAFLSFILFMWYSVCIDFLCWIYRSLWHETNQMMAFDLFNVLLNSFCKDFIEDICICVH
jgi:hypothetical protein